MTTCNEMAELFTIRPSIYLFGVLRSFQHCIGHITRIVTNHRKYAHVTPILKKLHWLPVKYRCIFKTATLVYKFLHSGSPSYFGPFLSPSSCPYSTRRSHPDHQYLTVPPFHSSVFKSTKHFGLSFAFDAPKTWNELPQDVRCATSVASFRSKLKIPVCKSLPTIASPVTSVSLWYDLAIVP